MMDSNSFITCIIGMGKEGHFISLVLKQGSRLETILSLAI